MPKRSRDCLIPKQLKAFDKFKQDVEFQGGTVIGEWVNKSTGIDCVCANDHPCKPSPDTARKRHICQICDPSRSKVNQMRAKQEFIATIEARGETVIGIYVNMYVHVLVRCAEGHEYLADPRKVQRDTGFCPECNMSPHDIGELKFNSAIQSQGGIVVGHYRGWGYAVDCVCAMGHKCAPMPDSIFLGNGMCWECGVRGKGLKSVKESLATQQCVLVSEDEYKSHKSLVHILCSHGHNVERIANNAKRNPACPMCYPKYIGQTKTGEALTELGLMFGKEFRIDASRSRFDYVLAPTPILIEFDGDQHFNIGCFTPDLSALHHVQAKDLSKMDRAFAKGYKLLRIDYKWTQKTVAKFMVMIQQALDLFQQHPHVCLIVTDASMYTWLTLKLQPLSIHESLHAFTIQ